MKSTRQVKECTFVTHDGVELFYRHWPSQTPTRGAIVMFHRGHEHSGRIAHLARIFHETAADGETGMRNG